MGDWLLLLELRTDFVWKHWAMQLSKFWPMVYERRVRIGVLAAFVGAQNRFRLETLGYAIEQVLTYGQNSIKYIVFVNGIVFETGFK